MSNIFFCAILVYLTTGIIFVSCDEFDVPFDVSIFRSIDSRVAQRCANLDFRKEIDDYWLHCIKGKFNVIDIMMHLPTLNTQICSEIELIDCIEKHRKKFAVCLNKEQLEEVSDDVLNSVKAGFDHVCSNNERVLEDFNNQKTKNCFSKMKPDLTQCKENMPKDWMEKTMPDDFISIIFRSKETCHKRGQWATCVVQTLDKCSDKLAKKVARGVFEAMLLGSPCKDHIYNSFPLLLPSAELEVKNNTKPPTATTDKTTTAITQPVIDEQDKTKLPTQVSQRVSDNNGNERVPALGLHVLISCLYVVLQITHICWFGN